MVTTMRLKPVSHELSKPWSLGVKLHSRYIITNVCRVKWIRAMKSPWTSVINNRDQDLLQKSQPCLESPRSPVWDDTHYITKVPGDRTTIMHAQTIGFPFLMHKLLSSTCHYLMEKGRLFQVSGKNCVGVTNLKLVYFIAFLKSFFSMTKKLPIKKALNLAFPLAISNKMLSDTFIFGVGTLRNRLLVNVCQFPRHPSGWTLQNTERHRVLFWL